MIGAIDVFLFALSTPKINLPLSKMSILNWFTIVDGSSDKLRFKKIPKSSDKNVVT